MDDLDSAVHAFRSEVTRLITDNDLQGCYAEPFLRLAACADILTQHQGKAALRNRWPKDFSTKLWTDLLRNATSQQRATDIVAIEGGSLLDQDLNDTGNVERLLLLHGSDMLHCEATKRWLIWDGRRWKDDHSNRATEIAISTMGQFYAQAKTFAPVEAVTKWARASGNNSHIAALLALAKAKRPVTPKELDSERTDHLLNCRNGTVDLRTSSIKPHDRDDLITKMVPYDYVPKAYCPRWLAFVDWCMGGGPEANDGELERSQRIGSYLQRAMGYSFTGVTKDKCMFALRGRSGNNGKTTMLEVLRALAADYGAKISIDSLMASSQMSSNNSEADLADLRGARFAVTSEAEDGHRLSQSRIKQLTQGTGDHKSTRKFENPVTCRETHHLWLDSNKLPPIQDTNDPATVRRIHLIEFPRHLEEDDPQLDKDLQRKLLDEAEGILSYVVAGAGQYFAHGLDKPAEILANTKAWQNDSNRVLQFVEECCKVGEFYTVEPRKLYVAYKQWCEDFGQRHLPENKFKEGIEALTQFGITWNRAAKRYYWGVRLKETGE